MHEPRSRQVEKRDQLLRFELISHIMESASDPSVPKSEASQAGSVPPTTADTSGSERVHPRDPLHGITLEKIVSTLAERHGWAEMGRHIPVGCFLNNPSVKSSLTFLRKTPWARKRVEDWFIAEL